MKILVSGPRTDCSKASHAMASHAISDHWQLLPKYTTPNTFACHLVIAPTGFSPFPVFQETNGLPQTSPVYSFPIPLCGLLFATHVASSILADYHPLLAPSLPGLELEGDVPLRDQTSQDRLSSALNSMKHFCTKFWELWGILCCWRVLGQRQYAWSSSALFLQHRNNCDVFGKRI